MTNKELKEKIAHLEKLWSEVEERSHRLEVELKEVKKVIDGSGVFKPEYKEDYWYIDNDGGVYSDLWENYNFDKNIYSIGNCFPTEQLARDTVRALKLIQKARESQEGFVPDWGDATQDKYSLNFNGSWMDTAIYNLLNIAPIFGFWNDESVCKQFIQENHEELIWFFMEHKR